MHTIHFTRFPPTYLAVVWAVEARFLSVPSLQVRCYYLASDAFGDGVTVAILVRI